MADRFAATRASGLDVLAGFGGRAGAFYAGHRNTEAAPGEHTSGLSPYLRRRMVLEAEAARAACDAHGNAAEKFVHEIAWRGYFKGFLELRPSIWSDYRRRVVEAQAAFERAPALAHRYREAIAGETGIEGFDDWAKALVAENWLHNHARMWFASIWIFTLGLPWALGADFFMRHLLDGDPASNTLSWRWVAGLHTRGKHYVATAENIRRFTGGRYAPGGLNERPAPLVEPAPPPARALPDADAPPDGEAALLIHLDDMHPESLELGRARIVRVCPLLVHAEDAAEAVKAFDRVAMADALDRAAAQFGCEVGAPEPGLATVTAWAPVGPSAARMPAAARVRRTWDEAIWPHCSAGYRQVRELIDRGGVTF